MPNQERICIAITKSNMGGAQKYVLILAEELIKAGQNVTVLAGGNGTLFKELSKKNIPFIKLKQSQRDISIIKEIHLAYELFKIFRKIRPTILHTNSSKMGGIGGFIGRIVGIKKIFFTAHGWAFNENRSLWQKNLLTFFYWITILISTKTICVSEQTKKQIYFLPFIKNKLVTIYIGIQIPNFYDTNTAREKLALMFPFLNIQKKWIGVLAELHHVKGHDLLIQAISQIPQFLEEYQFVCMGSGEQLRRLNALVHYKNVEKYISFTGFVENASEYLRAFTALILPSRTEALGIVILEAGLAKIPVLASSTGGIPEIIDDGSTGFLFEKENVEELTKKILFLSKLPQEDIQKITNTLYKKIENKFSVFTMISNTKELYK